MSLCHTSSIAAGGSTILGDPVLSDPLFVFNPGMMVLRLMIFHGNITFRELTYPTLGKGRPSSKSALVGDMSDM